MNPEDLARIKGLLGEDIRVLDVQELGEGHAMAHVRVQAAGAARDLITAAHLELDRIHEAHDRIGLAHLIASSVEIYRRALFVEVLLVAKGDLTRAHTVALDMHAAHQRGALAGIQREIEDFFAAKARGDFQAPTQ